MPGKPSNQPTDVTIRAATADDAEVIHELICALALYEREPDAVVATPASLRAQMESSRPPFECLIAERADVGDAARRAIGFALFFHNYSTWRGRQGIWLEDLFVREEERGAGAGRELLRAVGRVAKDRSCGRLEFAVLDWNAPAIGFYRSLSGKPMDDWTIFRFEDEALTDLAS